MKAIKIFWWSCLIICLVLLTLAVVFVVPQLAIIIGAVIIFIVAPLGAIIFMYNAVSES